MDPPPRKQPNFDRLAEHLTAIAEELLAMHNLPCVQGKEQMLQSINALKDEVQLTQNAIRQLSTKTARRMDAMYGPQRRPPSA